MRALVVAAAIVLAGCVVVRDPGTEPNRNGTTNSSGADGSSPLPGSLSFADAGSLVPGRSRAAAVSVAGQLVIVGGYAEGARLDEVAVYDPQAREGKVVARLPEPRAAPAAVVVAGVIYVLGGDGGSTTHASIVRITPGTWTVDDTGARLPFGRTAPAAAVVGGKVFLFGGCPENPCSNATADIVSYDPASGTVRTLAARLPTGVAAASAVNVGSVAYVFGGCGQSPCGDPPARRSGDVVRFDPAAERAERVAGLPQGRGLSAAAFAGGAVWLIGGYDGATTAVATRFDPASNAVSPQGLLPTARDGLAATVHAGEIWVFGGSGCTEGACRTVLRGFFATS